jgi:hypothetical protein
MMIVHIWTYVRLLNLLGPSSARRWARSVFRMQHIFRQGRALTPRIQLAVGCAASDAASFSIVICDIF